jgi:phage-related protein
VSVEAMLCPFCDKNHPVVTYTPITRDEELNEVLGEPIKVVLLECYKREPISLELFNTRPIEESLRDEIELIRQILIDNESYCLDVAHQRDAFIEDSNRLYKALFDMQLLIAEHGGRVMLSHSTRILNGTIALQAHRNLLTQETR